MQAVIPHNSNRDSLVIVIGLCVRRGLIECFFDKVKHYRRVFSGSDKLARSYMGFIRFVSALIWL